MAAGDKKIERLQFDGMGFKLWFDMETWKPGSDRVYWENKTRITLTRIRRQRIHAIQVFIWINDGRKENAHYNHIAPFQRKMSIEGRPYILNKYKQKSKPRWRSWCRLIAETDNNQIPYFYMSRYNEVPFRNNINGVRRFLDPKAIKHQIRLIRWHQRIEAVEMARAGRADYIPRIRIMNEPNCKMNHDLAHIWLNWHMAIWDGIKDLYELDNLWLCSGACESIIMPFIGPNKCPKCGQEFGSKENLDSKKRRRVKTIVHGVSIEPNLYDGHILEALGSAWPLIAASGDGGCGEQYYNIARGTKLYRETATGKWFLEPGPGRKIVWAQGDADQTAHMYSIAAKVAKRKGKIWVYAPVDFGQFEIIDGILIENFHPARINWEMFKKLRRADERIFGE